MPPKTIGLVPPGEFRQVSELRIQFFCEYRHFLTETIGDSSSPASRMGERLHRKVARKEFSKPTLSPVVRVLLFLLILFAGIIWILW